MGLDITGLGSAFDFAKGLLDRFWPKQATEAEKLDAAANMVPMIEERDSKVVEAQKEIIVAEMQQGDKYTKRARPSVVYCGLIFIGLVHVIFPFIIRVVAMWKLGALADVGSLANSETAGQVQQLIKQMEGLMSLNLPDEFWWAWGSVVSIWSIGRSAERRGVTGKLLAMITGGKKS